MFKRISILTVFLLLFALLGGSALAQQRDVFDSTRGWPAREQAPLPIDDDDEDEDDDAFGKKIAGTWLGSGEFALDADIGGGPATHCDGVADLPPTVYPFDSQSFTASGFWLVTQPLDPLPGHGTWKRTGPFEITGDSIGYIKNPLYDPAVDPPIANLEWVMRIPAVFTFDEDFQTATSTFGAVGYFPTQDPLDPDEPPAWCTVGGHYELRKVNP